MQWRQDKDQKPDTTEEEVASAHKAAVDNAAATHVPAWANVHEVTLPAGLQAKLTISQPGDVYEQEADRMAEQVMRKPDAQSSTAPNHSAQDELRMKGMAGSNTHAAGDTHPIISSLVNSDGGRPLDSTTRTFMEPRFGADFSNVQMRQDDVSAAATEILGARAFAYRGTIWLGPNESVHDEALMAHELAHVAQQENSVIGLRQATWIERRAWLSFFDHYLPRKFLNNYMDDTGAPIILTDREMIDCNPVVDLNNSTKFLAEVAKLRAAGGGSSTIAVSGWGGAMTNGTLGNFTIYYEGNLTVTSTGSWTFDGTMHFYDYWDFDPKPFGKGSGRPIPAEIKVRVAHYGLPGKPFDINSVKVPVHQTDADSQATWAGGTPTPVPEKSARTGLDIGAGDVGGAETGTGDVGEVGGSEAGAQSSEDLNKKK